MPKTLTLWILSIILLLFSCTKELSPNTQSSQIGEGSLASKLLDTSLRDQVLDTAQIDYISYKAHVENPSHGYIKKIAADKYDLEVMYRPISYEALLGLETFSESAYAHSRKEKARVLSFSIKRTEKSASALDKSNKFALHIIDDSTGAKLEPVYFLSDHKLGNTEVFYVVFDRASVAQVHGGLLHLIWTENNITQDIYYTKRILKQDFTHIQHVK